MTVKPRPEGSPAVVFLTFQMELPLISGKTFSLALRRRLGL
jgi:hypothetical protein